MVKLAHDRVHLLFVLLAPAFLFVADSFEFLLVVNDAASDEVSDENSDEPVLVTLQTDLIWNLGLVVFLAAKALLVRITVVLIVVVRLLIRAKIELAFLLVLFLDRSFAQFVLLELFFALSVLLHLVHDPCTG